MCGVGAGGLVRQFGGGGGVVHDGADRMFEQSSEEGHMLQESGFGGAGVFQKLLPGVPVGTNMLMVELRELLLQNGDEHSLR